MIAWALSQLGGKVNIWVFWVAWAYMMGSAFVWLKRPPA
jgi:hypothetical protein